MCGMRVQWMERGRGRGGVHSGGGWMGVVWSACACGSERGGRVGRTGRNEAHHARPLALIHLSALRSNSRTILSITSLAPFRAAGRHHSLHPLRSADALERSRSFHGRSGWQQRRRRAARWRCGEFSERPLLHRPVSRPSGARISARWPRSIRCQLGISGRSTVRPPSQRPQAPAVRLHSPHALFVAISRAIHSRRSERQQQQRHSARAAAADAERAHAASWCSPLRPIRRRCRCFLLSSPHAGRRAVWTSPRSPGRWWRWCGCVSASRFSRLDDQPTGAGHAREAGKAACSKAEPTRAG